MIYASLVDSCITKVTSHMIFTLLIVNNFDFDESCSKSDFNETFLFCSNSWFHLFFDFLSKIHRYVT